MRLAILLVLLALFCPKKEEKRAKGEIETRALYLKNETLRVEIADTEEERRVGLSYRKELPKNRGMLFIFEKDGIYPFWMKDTEIPLDIAFIDKDGVIIDIQSMRPLDALTLYFPEKEFRYALEVNRGYFALHRIKVGDTVYNLPR